MLAAVGIALLLIAGCAAPTRANRQSGTESAASWSGRLSLRLDSEPPQSFAALFDLRGSPEAGELVLTTPIGSTLARLRWAPGEALLQNGSQSRNYPSVEALIEAATGAAIPVDALFAWLAGRDAPAPGWQADLSQFADGRLQARRDAPLPAADLRIVLDRP